MLFCLFTQSITKKMRKLVLAVTGASGSIYFKLLLDKLSQLNGQWEQLAIVMSDNAREVWETELGNSDYKNYDLPFYDKNDFTAPFASGSGKFDTMIIVPCSMGTLGRIASGISNDLITRAADVVLKERRRLICVVRAYQEHGNSYHGRRDHLSCHSLFLFKAPNPGGSSRHGC
jgi:flavin prenyltransferase